MVTYSLSNPEIEHYRREGYVVVPSLIGPEFLGRVDETIGEITRRALASGNYGATLELEPERRNGKPVPRRIYDPFECHEVFREIATDPRILDRIECLIGPDFGLQHSKLNMKPPRVGSLVEWHQDLAYFPHTNDALVTTLVYLDEATEENGCLQVLPRQHHHYLDHSASDGTFAGMIREDLSDGRHGTARPLPAPAGSVIFLHCLLPHSSLANRSEMARRSLIFEYRSADSFPIYFSERVFHSEAKARHLRGKPARFARFGGPPPLIPALKEFKSLYELQARARKKLGGEGSCRSPL